MTDHIDLDVIAALSEGLLDRREARRARLHLHSCANCAAQAAALAEVPAVLRRISRAEPPPVPAWVAERLDAALAAEALTAGALTPGTGANGTAPAERAPAEVASIADGRRRRRRGRAPGSRVLRPLAAAAAVCLLAGGGYAVFRAAAPHAGSTSAAVSHRPAATGTLHGGGPLIKRGGSPTASPGTTTPEVISSGVNYQPAQLQAQVESVLRQTATERHQGGTGQNSPQLPASMNGCMQRVIGAQQPTLVDEATYRSQRATVIVTPEANGPGGEVWVTGAGCSAAHPDVLAHTSVSSIP